MQPKFLEAPQISVSNCTCFARCPSSSFSVQGFRQSRRLYCFASRFYSLPSRVDFLESCHAHCLDWFSGLSLALSNLCDLLVCCLRNFAFSELGIVSQLGNCVVKVSNVSLKSFSLVRLITASATMFTFSLSAASSSKLTSWFLRSVTMQRWSIPHLLTLWPLRVTSIWFLLTILLLIYTLRSREYKKWSPTREAFDY